MIALLGLNHGNGEGVLILAIAILVILVGVVGYRWVERSENRPISRRRDRSRQG
jgi:hypothetical protein